MMPIVKSIRGGSGLGDSLYVQSVARHLVANGHQLEVCSDWPDVFSQVGNVTVVPYRRTNVDIVAHYMQRRDFKTDQFEDVCISARLDPAEVEMKIDWRIVGNEHLKKIKPNIVEPIIAVQLPRNPLGKERDTDLGADLLPNLDFMQRAVDRLAGRAFLVQVGRGTPRWHFRGLDLDLANRTTVAELLDVASLAAGFFGYCSFMVPLAESFQKPALFAWSQRGLDSRDGYTRRVRPEKILHYPSSHAVIDNVSDEELERAIDEFLDEVRNPAGLPGEARGDRRERAGVA